MDFIISFDIFDFLSFTSSTLNYHATKISTSRRGCITLECSCPTNNLYIIRLQPKKNHKSFPTNHQKNVVMPLLLTFQQCQLLFSFSFPPPRNTLFFLRPTELSRPRLCMLLWTWWCCYYYYFFSLLLQMSNVVS